MKIVKNYFYNAAYQVFVILIPIITVPYISRTLGPDGVGTYAYTNSVMTYFVLLANVGLSLYGNRTIAYYRNDRKELTKKFYEIVILKIVMMLLSFGTLLIFLIFYQKYRMLLLAQSVQLIAVGFDISWFFVGIEDFKKTVGRNILVKTISLFFIFLLVKQPSDLTLYILIIGLSTLLGNLTLWSYMKRYLVKIPVKSLEFGIHVMPVLALFVPQLATNIFITLNRLMLGNYSTLGQTGYFDNADKVVRIFLAFINALGIVVFPRIANYYKEGKLELVEKYVRYAFNVVSMISFPIAFGIFIVSKPFSVLFFGAQFDGIEWVLSVLAFELIFMGWSSIIGQQYMVAINEVKGLTASMVISLVVCVIGSYLLIPNFGALGAAIMSVIGEGIIILVQLLVVRNFLDFKCLFEETWKYLLSSVVMFLGCYFIKKLYLPAGNFPQLLYLGGIGVIIYLIMILLLKPKTVTTFVQMAKEKFTH